MRKHVKRGLVFVSGIFLVAIGLAGLVLPILPGIILFAVGIILLSLVSPAVRWRLEKLTRAYPKVHSIVIGIENRVGTFVGDI
jgi:uncharacterized membrane protein YbaN (DUF454 family)